MSPNFSAAQTVLEEAVARRVFPGAAFGVLLNGELVCSAGVGRFTYGSASPPVAHDTVYDLASVSKVVATTSMAMLLAQRGIFELDAPVIDVVPAFAIGDPRKERVTFRMLLAHSSGLPDYLRLFEQAGTVRHLLRMAILQPLERYPLTRAEYSDIGFIVLGAVLERIAGESLAVFCGREVFGPLGMDNTRFRPPQEWRSRIPPTVSDGAFRRRVIQGEVHDENAAVLGGIAGHAGLFSNVPDLARFSREMLLAWQGKGSGLFKPETVRQFTRREIEPRNTSRALGWDTPSHPSQSGRYFSPQSFGHLGYTGTSLWIDPERELAVILLTNRTWPDRSNNEIKQVRPRFHDAVVEAL